MYDGGKILIGLGAFAVLITIPIWLSLATGGSGARPELVLPKEGGKCVEDTEYMRTSHMDLLSEWRDIVVREGRRTYTAKDGREHEMSLTRTCMSCHESREQFCTRCHEYVDLQPYCWDCHVEPNPTQGE